MRAAKTGIEIPKSKLEDQTSAIFKLRFSTLGLYTMPEFKVDGETLSFWLRVKPRASRERLTVDASGELRLELHAPAAEGQANEACIRMLARLLHVPLACVVIVSGHKARRKLLRVTGRTPQECIAEIDEAVTSDK